MAQFFFLIFLAISSIFPGCQATQKSVRAEVEKRVVIVSVANLRGEPMDVPVGLQTPAASKNLICQDSQVLFGETVLVDPEKSTDKWFYVRVENQVGFLHGSWRQYFGYIKKTDTCLQTKKLNPNLVVTSFDAILYEDRALKKAKFPLSFGTYIEGILTADGMCGVVCPDGNQHFITPEHVTSLDRVRSYSQQEIRDNLIAYAKKIKGIPYAWGGRSMMKPWISNDYVIGVDCSGLVDLLFRACGKDLPRNSNSQYLKTFSLVKGADVKKGDLIFLQSGVDPEKISHVALNAGNEKILHSSGRGFSDANNAPDKAELALCEESSEKLMGALIRDLNSGDVAPGGEWVGRRVYFKSVFNQAKDLVEIIKLDSTIKVDMPYARHDNFTKSPVYSIEKAALHQEVADALIAAQKELANHGYGIKIWDAYRPFSVQEIFWKLVPDPRYVADPRRGSKHNRGAAVDITLINLSDGSELEMPTEFDNFTIQARSHTTKNLSKTAIRNRQLLRRVMEKYGFDVEPTEWWHFNFKGWEKFAVLDVPLEDIK